MVQSINSAIFLFLIKYYEYRGICKILFYEDNAGLTLRGAMLIWSLNYVVQLLSIYLTDGKIILLVQ